MRKPLQYIDIVPFILHLVSSCLHISPSLLKSVNYVLVYLIPTKVVRGV